MKIKGKETVENERLDFGQLDYLKERYESLDDTLFNKFEKMNDEWDISVNWSNQSEALYILIQKDNEEGLADAYSLSFRNHPVYCDNSRSDNYLYFKDFGSWKEAKKAIMNWINGVVV